MTNINSGGDYMGAQASVKVDIQNGVGWIKLNRPQALNSLNVEMVETISTQLKEWQTDNKIALICIHGEGSKGFCAGGDMRKLYDLKNTGIENYAERFFSTEYQLDYNIHHYPKPILVYMNGIVMGGGVGLSIGASHRIVTETTKWAMPEMNIGFFPDVGASYFLNRMPGHVGRYLALTANILKAGDVFYVGAGDYYLENAKWDGVIKEINETNWHLESAHQKLNLILEKSCITPEPSSSIKLLQKKIDEHFHFNTLEEIIASLEESAHKGDEWAQATVDIILSKSPTSLKVTLYQLQEGKLKSLKECLDMEMNVAMNFMKSHDFYEGIRSVLVDKDYNPKWKPISFNSVTEDKVTSFFQS